MTGSTNIHTCTVLCAISENPVSAAVIKNVARVSVVASSALRTWSRTSRNAHSCISGRNSLVHRMPYSTSTMFLPPDTAPGHDKSTMSVVGTHSRSATTHAITAVLRLRSDVTMGDSSTAMLSATDFRRFAVAAGVPGSEPRKLTLLRRLVTLRNDEPVQVRYSSAHSIKSPLHVVRCAWPLDRS